MRCYRVLASVIFGLLTFSAVPVAAHDNDAAVRPRLENYANYNEFLAAMYAYKKQLELDKRFANAIMINIQSPELNDKPDVVSVMPIKSPEMDSLVDVYVPPLVITGPESLEMAIEAAKKFLHPTYQQPLRYNRTTAQSFPLKPLESSSLEAAAITNSFNLYSSPDVELQVAESLAGGVPVLKLKDTEEQSDQMGEEVVNSLKHAGTFLGNDMIIIGPDINQVNITVINR